MCKQTVNLTRSLLQEYDKGLVHTHAGSHNSSLVDSFRCLRSQLAKKFRRWTDMQHWHAYRRRDLTDRVQLASRGSRKRNRCVRDFDLGEYQMGWGSTGWKRGCVSVSIIRKWHVQCVSVCVSVCVWRAVTDYFSKFQDRSWKNDLNKDTKA